MTTMTPRSTGGGSRRPTVDPMTPPTVEKIEDVRKGDKDLNRLLNKLTEQLGA